MGRQPEVSEHDAIREYIAAMRVLGNASSQTVNQVAALIFLRVRGEAGADEKEIAMFADWLNGHAALACGLCLNCLSGHMTVSGFRDAEPLFSLTRLGERFAEAMITDPTQS